MRAHRHQPIVRPQPPARDLFQRAMATVANAIFITDAGGRIVWVNEAFSRLSGYAAAEAAGRTPAFLRSGKQDATFYRELWQTLLAGKVWRGEVVERHKDGGYYTVDQVITPLRDDDGTITHFIAVQHDITQRKQEGERERFLAYHDPLTGLPNRALFLDVLAQSLAGARRTHGMFALLYVDVDNFKSINDTVGHYGGDRLLVAVAERLSAAVRKTDTVARLGGDEFAVLQADLRHPDAAAALDIAGALAHKLLQALAQPFVLEGYQVCTSVSIGIAMYPADGETAEDLLRNADQAMYRAKNLGRNRYHACAAHTPLPHDPQRPTKATAV